MRLADAGALLATCAALLALAEGAAGYRLLVVFPNPSHSHAILGKAVVKTLLEAGHDVTYVTPFPYKDPPANLELIDVSFMIELYKKYVFTDLKPQQVGLSFVRAMGYNSSSGVLQGESVQRLLMDRTKKFDAVLTEWFFSDLYAGLAKVLQCPWIVMSSMGMHVNLEYLVDEVQSPAVSPAIITGFAAPMTLYQRVVNTAVVFTSLFCQIFVDHPREAQAYERLYGPAAHARGVALPDYSSAVHDVALLFLNSHPAMGQATRLPPNAVEVGGFHIGQHAEPLPPELQKLLDDSPQGVVYFSMGSNFKSSDLPPEQLQQLVRTLGALPLTVLWKFEADLKVPANVHVRPWFPQPGVLAHKNTKVFITHGGLLSTTEAISCGVPLIGIPVFGDQPMNTDRAVKMGYAIRVDLKSAQIGEDLGNALQKILTDPSYTATAKHLSQLFHDRPLPAARLVSYWTEYVVRTRGAPHLRTAATLVPAYQRYLLDIVALLVAALLLLFVLLRALVRFLLTAISGGSRKPVRPSKKKN